MISRSPDRPAYALGLDVGARSIGWALIRLRNDEPVGILRTGVRIFEAGAEGNFDQGKEASRAAERRGYRQPRRQHERRARRRRKIFHLLQSAGLLPSGPGGDSQARHELLLGLDRELAVKLLPPEDRVAAHKLTYQLRADALTRALDPHELGRALYQLAQRRGYRSNRVADAVSEEDEAKQKDLGAVASGIQELDALRAGRTLGQYFASIDPEEKRIRQRWTAREMYLDEFDRIIAAQRAHHPLLADEKFCKRLRRALFHQRPLKSAKHLIGRCTLEPRWRRASLAIGTAQEFRLWQQLNHLRVKIGDQPERPLTADERSQLAARLVLEGDVKFADAKETLGWSSRGKNAAKFSVELAGEKRLVGLRTQSKLRGVLGECWDKLPTDKQDQLVYELLAYRSAEALVRRLQSDAWSFSLAQAKALSELSLERDYGAHSRKAMDRLLPFLRAGLSYSEARQKAYPDSFQAGQALAKLPPVLDPRAFPGLKNPAVLRALSELRKVVNAIVREHGLPESIRIELARDLKRSKRDRQTYSERMRKQEASREKALAEVLKAVPGHQVRAGRDPLVEKWLLAEECNWRCPYTGKEFGATELLSKNSPLDVEHIYPRRYLDNSFANKTLCWAEENRHVKQGRLPAEVYAHTERWPEILARVNRFSGELREAKLKRFQATDVPDDFAEAQLNDTRHNSVLAANYVGLLYGGRWDHEGRQRVFTNTGGLTALLRGHWKLNQIVGHSQDKNRADHRQHAIDAAVVAVCTDGIIQCVSKAAEKAHSERLDPVDPPWLDFFDDLRRAVLGIIVSHRADLKLGGKLHADTNYSPPQGPAGGDKQVYHVRKPLVSLSAGAIDDIVDDKVRQVVRKALEDSGLDDPKKAFQDVANHPYLTSKDGRKIPIHRVRVKVTGRFNQVGQGPRARFVGPGDGTNHHAAILAIFDSAGNIKKWEDVCVSRLTIFERWTNAQRAMRAENPSGRSRRPVEVFLSDWGPNKRLLFTLRANEGVLMNDGSGQVRLFRVVSVSDGMLEFQEHSDARDSITLRKLSRARTICSGNGLRIRNARKVIVSPLGEVTIVAPRDE